MSLNFREVDESPSEVDKADLDGEMESVPSNETESIAPKSGWSVLLLRSVGVAVVVVILAHVSY